MAIEQRPPLVVRAFNSFFGLFTYDNFRPLMVLACILVMMIVGQWAVPRDVLNPIDRVYYWVFVIFAVGLAELFVLLLMLAILGKVDLISVLSDEKENDEYVDPTVPRISFARLQAFLWTLIILVAYFHKAVTDEGPELPELNPNLILVMGISGAVYLFSKQQSTTARQAQPKTQPKRQPAQKESAPAAAGELEPEVSHAE